jgi:DNA-binding response OmpR family regulator
MTDERHGTKRHLLLVEDDENTRTAMARWLAYEYDVVTACDGQEAIEIAASRRPAPEVIVADLWMPRVDGVEMLSRLKAFPLLRTIPVILLTGQTSASSVIAGISAGARTILHKPVDLDVLDRKVKSALARERSLAPPTPVTGGRAPFAGPSEPCADVVRGDTRGWLPGPSRA